MNLLKPCQAKQLKTQVYLISRKVSGLIRECLNLSSNTEFYDFVWIFFQISNLFKIQTEIWKNTDLVGENWHNLKNSS